MFTPIGYFQSAAGGGAFDPTLGGTLSPTHWWDYSDAANLTFSAGTTVNGILDKGTGGVDVTTADGWTFYNGGPTYNGSSVSFNDNVIYKTTTWPASMVAADDVSTWVMIGKLNPLSTGIRVFTGNRVGSGNNGYALFHPGALNDSGVWRANTYNNNNGAASNTTPQFFEASNKTSTTNYGSYYSGVDIYSTNMYATLSLKNSTTSAFATSLNGLPFGGQSPAYSLGNRYSGYVAMGGSGLEVTFGRYSNLAWYGDIEHIVVYHGVELTSQQLSDLYATL